jgi:hypothetical protein
MKQRTLRSLAATFAFLAQACSDGTGGGTGTLQVRLTDKPFPFSEVTSVDVFIVRIDARTTEPSTGEAEDEDNMSGWTTIAEPNASVNLLTLSNGTTMNLGEATLPTGTYNGFRLIIDPAQSSITLTDGSNPQVFWPSAAQTGIKINLDAPVTLTESGSMMVVDFDVGRSFVMRGNSISQNGLNFKPVLRGTAVDITGSASGTVRGDNATGPLVAGATVEVLTDGTLIGDTDDTKIVATTVTDANGAFKFGFLLPGAYELRVTPPTGSVYVAGMLASGFNVTTGQETTGLAVILGR